MRKLIVWNLMPLDGKFEGGKPWDLAFHALAWAEELEALSLEQGENAGALLFGRSTYEGMAAYWSKEADKEPGRIADFMNRLKKYVASSKPLDPPWNNSERLDGDIVEAVRGLKAGPGKDLYVFGSAKLMDSLLRAHMVDELRICIAPVILGQGVPLFKDAPVQFGLKLTMTTQTKNGAVILRYDVRN
jgi:dihydrofolate reductase